MIYWEIESTLENMVRDLQSNRSHSKINKCNSFLLHWQITYFSFTVWIFIHIRNTLSANYGEITGNKIAE